MDTTIFTQSQEIYMLKNLSGSRNLKQGLQSENAGLQQSIMRHIIRYGDKVPVGDGMLEIFRTYRSDDDLQTRCLTLAKTGRFRLKRSPE